MKHVDTPTVLSLYSGGGGLDLGFRLANPSARTVCYVEREVSAIALLVDRMSSGQLDDAPLWSDSGTFDGWPWRGKVDWIIGGFPCQPSSPAGTRRGIDDPRWLWPHIRRIMYETKPQGLFLENVRGLLSVNDGRAFGEIIRDLAGLGYDVEWCVLRASDVGAPHRRERIFILAYSTSQRSEGRGVSVRSGRSQQAETDTDRGSPELAHPADDTPIAQRIRGDQLGDADQPGLQGRQQPIGERAYECPAWPPSPSDTDAWAAVLRDRPDLAPAIESEVRGMANGMAYGLGRTDQLRILGNGVVPQQAALAFEILSARSHPRARP